MELIHHKHLLTMKQKQAGKFPGELCAPLEMTVQVLLRGQHSTAEEWKSGKALRQYQQIICESWGLVWTEGDPPLDGQGANVP